MSGLCEGRVAVITGAGRGIGREYALMLAEQGAKIVVNDLGGDAAGAGSDLTPAQQTVEDIRAAGGEAVVNGADVSDFDQAKAMIDQAVETFGGLDIVVNNAGILRDRMLVSMSEDEWDLVVKVHLKGTYAPSHHAANYWRERSKEGHENVARIINTTSASGIFGNVGQTNYGAAKAGIAAFTVIAAKELGRYGVTVNAIAPTALTRLTAQVGMDQLPEDTKAALDPKWIAPVVTWLCSPESSEVTGRVFTVSGQEIGVAEGWHVGPTAAPAEDPAALGAVIPDLVRQARPNATMFGRDE
ncbi:MAG: SDR family oxidoreductase [Acidimicrobiales bacterium]|nr:SDR family oxidoreductase [Acidimicrobiales bacterium]